MPDAIPHDTDILTDAVEVIRRRTSKPNGIFVEGVCRALENWAAKMRQEEVPAEIQLDRLDQLLRDLIGHWERLARITPSGSSASIAIQSCANDLRNLLGDS